MQSQADSSDCRRCHRWRVGLVGVTARASKRDAANAPRVCPMSNSPSQPGVPVVRDGARPLGPRAPLCADLTQAIPAGSTRACRSRLGSSRSIRDGAVRATLTKSLELRRSRRALVDPPAPGCAASDHDHAAAADRRPALAAKPLACRGPGCRARAKKTRPAPAVAFETGAERQAGVSQPSDAGPDGLRPGRRPAVLAARRTETTDSERTAGADWFTFAFDSDVPKLAFFALDFVDRDVPPDVRIYRQENGQVVEYTQGIDPQSLQRERPPRMGANKFTTRVLTRGTYFVWVDACQPEYQLRTKLFDVPPYLKPERPSTPTRPRSPRPPGGRSAPRWISSSWPAIAGMPTPLARATRSIASPTSTTKPRRASPATRRISPPSRPWRPSRRGMRSSSRWHSSS